MPALQATCSDARESGVPKTPVVSNVPVGLVQVIMGSPITAETRVGDTDWFPLGRHFDQLYRMTIDCVPFDGVQRPCAGKRIIRKDACTASFRIVVC